MLKKLGVCVLLLAANSAWAREVAVTLQDAQVKHGTLIGANGQAYYLEVDGASLKIPVGEIVAVTDTATGETLPVAPETEKPSAPEDSARSVAVTLKTGLVQRGKLAGINQQALYLMTDGQAQKIPLEAIQTVFDSKTGAALELEPARDPALPPPARNPGPEDRLSPPNNLSIEPVALAVGIKVLEWETRVSDSATVAARVIHTGPPLVSSGAFPASGAGLGLRYRFFLTADQAPRGFSLGPSAEFMRDYPAARWYWDAGAEFGYHWVWGHKLGFVLSVLGSLLYQNASPMGSDAEMALNYDVPGARAGLEINCGFGF